MEVAYAAVSSECFYEECSFFALFMWKETELLDFLALILIFFTASDYYERIISI